jgi:hypothetical protein
MAYFGIVEPRELLSASLSPSTGVWCAGFRTMFEGLARVVASLRTLPYTWAVFFGVTLIVGPQRLCSPSRECDIRRH